VTRESWRHEIGAARGSYEAGPGRLTRKHGFETNPAGWRLRLHQRWGAGHKDPESPGAEVTTQSVRPGFLPNLGTLRHQLEGALSGADFRRSYFQLELLPYTLGATYQALLDFVQAERELMLGRRLTDNQGKRMMNAIGAGGRDKLAYRLDTFLESARRTQNAVIPYISRAHSVSLPLSLADVIKRVEQKKIGVPRV